MSAILQDISEKLQKGKMKEVAELVKQAVADGIQPLTILNEGLMPGMDIIGERFKKTTSSSPKCSSRPRNGRRNRCPASLLVGDQMEEKGHRRHRHHQDDLHDIGKNLVRMMMESKGLNVIDLGNSVPPAKYIEAAAKHNADIIACSALLTTTMVHIKDVVKGVAESPLAGKVQIMIGGAPVNDAFRESIGADYYTPRRLLSRGKGPRNLRRREGVENIMGTGEGRRNPSEEGLPPPGPFHLPKTFDWWGGGPQKTPLYGRNGAEAKRKPRRWKHGKEAVRLSHASRRKAASHPNGPGNPATRRKGNGYAPHRLRSLPPRAGTPDASHAQRARGDVSRTGPPRHSGRTPPPRTASRRRAGSQGRNGHFPRLRPVRARAYWRDRAPRL